MEGIRKWKESWRERRKKLRSMEVPDDGVPYDRGWAWMIVLGGFVNFVVASGYNKATFLFFVEFLDQFQAPVTETALVFGVKAATNSLVGLFVMNAMLGRFGVRRTVFVGGVCISLSAILGSFATDLTSLILCQSLFHGLGMAALNMPTTVLLGYYFRRRRSLANSLTKCGVGVGFVIFPPITTLLLRHFGLRGALLITGALCLHTLVAAMLLRPVSLYKQPQQLAEGMSSPLLPMSSTLTTDHDDRINVKDDDDNIKAKEDTSSSTQNKNNANDDDENCVVQTIRSTAVDDNDDDSGKATNSDSNTQDENESNSDPQDSLITRNTCSQNSHLQTRIMPGSRLSVGADSEGFVSESQNGCVDLIEQEMRTTSCSELQIALALPPLLSCHPRNGISKSVPDMSKNQSNDLFPRRTSSFTDAGGRIGGDVSLPHHSGVVSGHVLNTLSQSKMARSMLATNRKLDASCAIIILPEAQPSKNTSPEDQPSPGGRCERVRGCMLAVLGVLDFSLFHSPMFRLLAVVFFTSPLTQTVTTYLPAMATQRGMGEHTALLLSIIGGLDFVSRLACGFLADLKIVKVSTMIGVAFIIVGVACQLTRLLTTFPLLIGLAVTQGMFGGVAACLMPILIMEDVGLENTAKAMGFQKLLAGAAMAAAHPFLGYLRDVTGGYDVSYQVMGAFTLLSAVFTLSLRLLPHHTHPSSSEKTQLSVL